MTPPLFWIRHCDTILCTCKYSRSQSERKREALGVSLTFTYRKPYTFTSVLFEYSSIVALQVGAIFQKPSTFLDMVTFALKTWKNKVKMHKRI